MKKLTFEGKINGETFSTAAAYNQKLTELLNEGGDNNIEASSKTFFKDIANKEQLEEKDRPDIGPRECEKESRFTEEEEKFLNDVNGILGIDEKFLDDTIKAVRNSEIINYEDELQRLFNRTINYLNKFDNKNLNNVFKKELQKVIEVIEDKDEQVEYNNRKDIKVLQSKMEALNREMNQEMDLQQKGFDFLNSLSNIVNKVDKYTEDLLEEPQELVSDKTQESDLDKVQELTFGKIADLFYKAFLR